MTTERRTLSVSGVQVTVVRKAIRNLHLGVYPPDGQVRVAAPLAVSDAAVRTAVIRKLRWIRRQQETFRQQAREPAQEMVSGESHYVFGRRYRLVVNTTDGRAAVVLRSGRMLELNVRAEWGPARREALLHRWYRDRLRELLSSLVPKWQKALGVEVAEWRVKRMKTRWGSCTSRARRIWLNLELAKKPVECLEYIVVHELVHLRLRRHDERFDGMMDRLLPRWRRIRKRLNAEPLANSTWRY